MFEDTSDGRLAEQSLAKTGPSRRGLVSPEWARLLLLRTRAKAAAKGTRKAFTGAEELRQLEERHASGDLQRFSGSIGNAEGYTVGKVMRYKHYTPEFQRLYKLQAQSRKFW